MKETWNGNDGEGISSKQQHTGYDNRNWNKKTKITNRAVRSDRTKPKETTTFVDF